MHLYTAQAPNPFRVNAFIAEKNIDIPTTSFNILAGETRNPEFHRKNSLYQLPVLELDDGSYLTESVAICRYLESLYPESPLLGTSPLEKAKVDMWTRRMEQQVLDTVGAIGLHTFPFFADKVEQVAEYANSMKRLLDTKWRWLDSELSDGRLYLCNESFSIADITGMAALWLCGVADIQVPEYKYLKRWEATVRAHDIWT